MPASGFIEVKIFFINEKRSFLLILNDFCRIFALKSKPGSVLAFRARVHCATKFWLNKSAHDLLKIWPYTSHFRKNYKRSVFQ